MTPDEVLRVAEAGAAAGCKEALFTLGDKPELRYRAAREGLEALGYESTLAYLADMAKLVLEKTPLLPHLNPGVLGREDLRALREVSPSQGMMLESASERLSAKGRAALRLARQAPGGAAGDAPPRRRGGGALHLRYPHRHR